MKLLVAGAAGRMGRTLVRAVVEQGHALAGAFDRPGSVHVGEDAGVLAGIGEIGVRISDDPAPMLGEAEGILDFTVPALSLSLATQAAEAGLVHVIGTTGFKDAQEAQIAEAARGARIVKSGNMSLGVNLLAALVEEVAASLDAGFDIEVLEMHHRNKVDAPSGTALLLGEAAARARGVSLPENGVYAREGHTGPRGRGDIGFATLRGGSVVGEHTVIFAGDRERIELAHKAEDRTIFANGAIRAAVWARDKPAGLYAMRDVLGLNRG